MLFGFNYRQHIDSLQYISDIIDTEKPTTIIELGTGDGFLSLLLSTLGIEFYTFDTCKPKVDIPKFHHKDILDNYGYIGNIIQTSAKCLLICDNGNKASEFCIYSKYAKTGDIIMIHDYFENRSDMYLDNAWRTCEVTHEDIDTNGFERAYIKPYIGFGVFRKL
jgi:hypothetical protein